MNDHYLPILKNYAYHCCLIIFLGKYKRSADEKKTLILVDVDTTRNYVERLSFEFNKEITKQLFINSLSLSTDNTSIRFLEKKDIIIYQNDTSIVAKQQSRIMYFHSHLADGALKMHLLHISMWVF